MSEPRKPQLDIEIAVLSLFDTEKGKRMPELFVADICEKLNHIFPAPSEIIGAIKGSRELGKMQAVYDRKTGAELWTATPKGRRYYSQQVVEWKAKSPAFATLDALSAQGKLS